MNEKIKVHFKNPFRRTLKTDVKELIYKDTHVIIKRSGKLFIIPLDNILYIERYADGHI